MLNLTKSQRVVVALSVIWTIISLVMSGVIAEESRGGFSIWTFLVFFIVFTCPVWILWSIRWVLGAGSLKNLTKKMINGIRLIFSHWLMSLSVIWFALYASIGVGMLLDGSPISMTLYFLLVGVLPSSAYWFYLIKTRKHRATPEYKQKVIELKARYPWRRFWARWLDWSVCGFFIVTPILFVIDFVTTLGLGDSLLEVSAHFNKMEGFYTFVNNPVIFSISTVLIWMPFEAALMSTIGTTLGKFLFGIKVLQSNGESKFKFKEALGRSVGASGYGAAFGFPLVNLAFFYSAYKNLRENKQTSWDQKRGLSVEFEKLGLVKKGIAFSLILLALSIAAYSRSIPTEDYSRYEEDVIKVGVIQKQMKERADKAWAGFNQDLMSARTSIQDPTTVKDMSAYTIDNAITVRLKFSTDLNLYKKKLLGNFKQYEEDIISSDIQVGLKREVLLAEEKETEEVKELISSYIDAVVNENKSYLDALRFLKKSWAGVSIEDGNILFSTPNLFEQYKKVIAIAEAAKNKSFEEQTRLSVFVNKNTAEGNSQESVDLSDSYLDIRTSFEGSEVYPLIKIIYNDNPDELDSFYKKYAEIYVDSGPDAAEQMISDTVRSLLDSRLSTSLPNASNAALFDFTQSVYRMINVMADKQPALCPDFLEGKTNTKEYIDFSQNQLDEDVKSDYYSSLVNVITSAEKDVGSYTFSHEDIEKYMESPMATAIASVGGRASFMVDGTPPKNPEDACIVIGAIYGEVLKMKSPIREDVLRYMLTEE